jgi:[histone H3]-lysine9 N-trimethyltransferase SUV39H
VHRTIFHASVLKFFQDHVDLDAKELRRVTRSSTPTLSSSNDVSDADNVLLIHAGRRSNGSSVVSSTSGVRINGPQHMRWNRGLLRKDLTPTIRYTKNIPHLLHDRLNQMDEFYRKSGMARAVLEATIVENTAEDEPKAPRIQVINDVDEESTPPWEFYYSNQVWLGEGISPPDYEGLRGCGCRGRCDPRSQTCLCVQRQHEFYEGTEGFIYDDKGRLRDHYYPIFECNDACDCTEDCPNRVSNTLNIHCPADHGISGSSARSTLSCQYC